MNKRTADWLSLALIALPVAFAIVSWPKLPDPMPSHWNMSGEVDGWMPKFWGVAVLPLTGVGIFVLMKLIPVISPKGFRIDQFRGVLHIVQVAILAFLALITVVVYLEALGVPTPQNRIVLAAVGLLFVVIGNYMGKVRKNFFLGIRTPWTLASSEVWARTHRLGGWLFMLGGITMLLGSLLDVRPDWPIGIAVALALYPVLHSYLLYRRIEGFEEDAPENDASG